MSELLPCPFCGCEAHIMKDIDRYAIGCSCDTCMGFIGLGWLYETQAEAIKAWNTRAAYEMEDFFYLPKPKQQLFSYTTSFSFDDMSLKANGSVDVYALVESVHTWQVEALNKLIVERICDVFKPERTCHKVIPDEMEGYVFCSECGAEIGEYGYPNYCPNCGAKVVNNDN